MEKKHLRMKQRDQKIIGNKIESLYYNTNILSDADKLFITKQAYNENFNIYGLLPENGYVKLTEEEIESFNGNFYVNDPFYKN